MFSRACSTCLALVLASPALLAGESPPAPPVLSTEEAEEPDFAFLAGGPYTQKKKSIQFICPTRWDWRRSGAREERAVATLLRFEWGITDRLELDVIANGQGMRTDDHGAPLNSFFTRSDSVLGMRYRLFTETSAPVTLTMGPQVILPTGRRELGTSVGATGYAWDVTLAKDWRGPVFLFGSLNFSFTPGARGPAAGSFERRNLQSLTWGTALGWRTLEQSNGNGSKHDVHTFFEFSGQRSDDLDAAGKTTSHPVVFAPGVRYGFLTARRKLFEIGASAPVGLNRAAPDFGLILQLQFEHVF